MPTPPVTTSRGGTSDVAAPVPVRPHPSRRYSAKSRSAPLWLLSPAAIVIVALIVAPILFLLFASFTDYDQRSLFTGQFSMAGISQYTAVLASAQFWWSLLLTVVFTAAMVIGSLVIGVAVAELLTRLGRVMTYIVTIAMILAWAMPNVAAAQIWNWLFQPTYGIVNWFLTRLGIFGNAMDTAWTNNTFLGLTCIWLLIVWQAVPLIALTTYAAQMQVDPAYLEAARLDGAGEVRIYFTIVMQFLRPTIMLLAVLSIIWDFNVFNQIWLVTQGGPNNTTATLGIWTYLVAFAQFKVAAGSAISVITTALLLVFTGFYIRSLLRVGEDL